MKKIKVKARPAKKLETERVVFLMPVPLKKALIEKATDNGTPKSWILNTLVTRYLKGEIKL